MNKNDNYNYNYNGNGNSNYNSNKSKPDQETDSKDDEVFSQIEGCDTSSNDFEFLRYLLKHHKLSADFEYFKRENLTVEKMKEMNQEQLKDIRATLRKLKKKNFDQMIKDITNPQQYQYRRQSFYQKTYQCSMVCLYHFYCLKNGKYPSSNMQVYVFFFLFFVIDIDE